MNAKKLHSDFCTNKILRNGQRSLRAVRREVHGVQLTKFPRTSINREILGNCKRKNGSQVYPRRSDLEKTTIWGIWCYLYMLRSTPSTAKHLCTNSVECYCIVVILHVKSNIILQTCVKYGKTNVKYKLSESAYWESLNRGKMLLWYKISSV